MTTDAKATKANISKKDLIKFINSSYQTLLTHVNDDYGVTDVCESTIDLIAEYLRGIIADVKKYICQNMGHIVINRFDDFEQILIDNPDLFDDLFQRYSLSQIQKYGMRNTLNVITHLYKKKGAPLQNKADSLIRSVSNDVEALFKTLNTNNVMGNDITIREYIKFLRKIQHIDANRFESIQHDLDKLLHQAIIQNGHTFSTKLPADEIKALITSDKPLFERMILLTQTFDDETKKYRGAFDLPPNNDGSLIDMVSTNIPTNEYFTFSHQKYLETILLIGELSIHFILSDNKLFNEYLGGYNELIKKIAEDTHGDTDELTSDFSLLIQMLSNIFCLQKDTNETIVHSLCYGAAVFICAFSEKILRLCYFEEMKDFEYIPLNKATIGTLLSDNNAAMVKILGKYQIKHLNFFLGQDKDGLVGKSYRNRLAHWNEFNQNLLTPQLICKLFYLLTCIITSVILYYLSEEDNTTNTENPTT